MKNIVLMLVTILLVPLSVPATCQTSSSNPTNARDTSQFRDRLQQLYDAWSDLDPSKPAKFYAKDVNLTFFDITPMKYKGWNEYAAGVPKAFADYKSGKFTVGDDLQVHRHGNLTWATCTWTGDLTRKDGSHENATGRYTAVWEKRGKDWLIVHEHMSVPLGPPAK